MNVQVEDKIFQFEAGCFGLSTLPQQFMTLMKVFLKNWRKQGIMTFVYLDDILVIAKSPKTLEKQTQKILEDLHHAGFVVNHKKSQLEPTQQVQYLGFHLNFEKGCLEVPAEKIKTVRREFGKLVTHKEMTPRKMSNILGVVRSFLVAIPHLRAFTDKMVQFVSQGGTYQKRQLGHTIPHSMRFGGPSPPSQRSSILRVRKTFRKKVHGTKFLLRRIRPWMGRSRPLHGSRGSRVLAAKRQNLAYKPKRTTCRLQYHTKFGTTRPNNTFEGRQSSHLLLPPKKWRQDRSVQCHAPPIFDLVSKPPNQNKDKLGPLPTNARRQIEQVGFRQTRLPTRPKNILPSAKHFRTLPPTRGRHVCESGERPTPQICVPVAPLASVGGRRFTNGFKQNPKLLCRPPLELGLPVATPTL